MRFVSYSGLPSPPFFFLTVGVMSVLIACFLLFECDLGDPKQALEYRLCFDKCLISSPILFVTVFIGCGLFSPSFLCLVCSFLICPVRTPYSCINNGETTTTLGGRFLFFLFFDFPVFVGRNDDDSIVPALKGVFFFFSFSFLFVFCGRRFLPSSLCSIFGLFFCCYRCLLFIQLCIYLVTVYFALILACSHCFEHFGHIFFAYSWSLS